MNTIREIDRINQQQLELGDQGSWHDDYKNSAYVFVGGIPYELTEGDVLCVFSQYGEILDLNMPRDRETGKTKGFAFLKYDDQRSTVLAVDNFNGALLLGRTLRVDHSRDYRQMKRRKRKEGEEEKSEEEEEEELDEEGKPRVKGFNVAPKGWLDPLVEESEDEVEEDFGEGIDIDDPMRDYLIEKRREEKKRQGTKKIKVDDEESKKHRHRHRSRREGEDEERRHHHHHHRHRSDRPRIEDGKREGEKDDDERRRAHRRRHRTPERRQRNDATPKRSRQDDRTPERGAHDETPPKKSRRDDHTPERSRREDKTPPRNEH
jgi:RNA-binding motif protein, X-linked 2